MTGKKINIMSSIVTQDIETIALALRKEIGALEGKDRLFPRLGFLESYFLAVLARLNNTQFKNPVR